MHTRGVSASASKRLREILQNLGDRPKDISEKMFSLQCFGTQKHSNICPLATYLIGLGYEKVRIDDISAGGWIGRDYAYTRLPKACLQFISSFDRNGFKKLRKKV